MAERPRRILFFIPEDWYVCSHRLPLVRAARAEGFDVVVVTRVRDHAAPIVEAGAELVPIRLRRGFHGLRDEAAGLRELVRIYRRVRPDIVHHVTPKSVIYGSLAARLARVPCRVNALAGLGFVYTATGRRAALRRVAVSTLFRLLLGGRGTRLIVQNGDDLSFFRDEIGVSAETIAVIRGAGVDTEAFAPAAREPEPPLRVCLVARLLGDKGVREAVAAARVLRERRDDVRLLLVGRNDPVNPASIADDELAAWRADGIVELTGHVEDVPALLRTCHAALLPSYREGLPKSLLEAAACGLPVIATDVPGCREICRDGVNGLLIPPRDVDGIVAAVERLADDRELRHRLGAASRRLAVDDFSEALVAERTVALYRELLGEVSR